MKMQAIGTHSKKAMKAFFLIPVAFILAIVVITTMSAAASAQGSAVCPANPSPPDAADPSIIVDQPSDGDNATSPLTIAGDARVFEANVRITLFDAAGSVLEDTLTTAAEGAPALAPFATEIDFDVDKETPACVRVFEESARDGSPRNVVQVEVNLGPATTPPSAGGGGLKESFVQDTHLWLYAAGSFALACASVLAVKRNLWD